MKLAAESWAAWRESRHRDKQKNIAPIRLNRVKTPGAAEMPGASGHRHRVDTRR